MDTDADADADAIRSPFLCPLMDRVEHDEMMNRLERCIQ